MTSPNPTGQSGPSPSLCISRRGPLIHSQASPRRVMAWRGPPLPFLAGRGPTGEGLFSPLPVGRAEGKEGEGGGGKGTFVLALFPSLASALFCFPPGGCGWGRGGEGKLSRGRRSESLPPFLIPPSSFPPFATVACDLGPLRRRRRKRRRRQNGERRKASV